MGKPIITNNNDWSNLIGVQYALGGMDKNLGLNCYGLVREVYKTLNIQLPIRDEVKLTEELAVTEGRNWIKILEPEPYAVVLIKTKLNKEEVLHLGVITPEYHLLQCFPNKGVVLSKIKNYEPYILGYYKYKNNGSEVLPQGEGGNTGRMVAMMAVAIGAMMVAPYAAPAIFSTSAAWAVGLTAAGLGIIGTLLVNLLMPFRPEGPDSQSLADSRTYTWEGIINETRQGLVKPMMFGTAKVGGQIISEKVWASGNRVEYYDALICPAYGKTSSFDQIYINDNEAEQYLDVQYETRNGDDEQTPISYFEDEVWIQYGSQRKIPLDESTKELAKETDYDLSTANPLRYVSFETKNQITKASIEFSAPQGLYATWVRDEGTEIVALPTKLLIQFRKVGESTWYHVHGYDATAKKQNPYPYTDTSEDGPMTFIRKRNSGVYTDTGSDADRTFTLTDAKAGTEFMDANFNKFIKNDEVTEIEFALIDNASTTHYCKTAGAIASVTATNIDFKVYTNNTRTVIQSMTAGSIPDGNYTIYDDSMLIPSFDDYDIENPRNATSAYLGFDFISDVNSINFDIDADTRANNSGTAVDFWTCVYSAVFGKEIPWLGGTKTTWSSSQDGFINLNSFFSNPLDYQQTFEINQNSLVEGWDYTSPSYSTFGALSPYKVRVQCTNYLNRTTNPVRLSYTYPPDCNSFQINNLRYASATEGNVDYVLFQPDKNPMIPVLLTVPIDFADYYASPESYYEFRICIVDVNGGKGADNQYWMDDIYLKTFSEITEATLAYPNHTLLGMRIKATDSLSGGRPNMTSILNGPPLALPTVTTSIYDCTVLSDNGYISTTTYVYGVDVDGMREVTISEDLPENVGSVIPISTINKKKSQITTMVPHGLVDDDEVWIYDISGMVELNNRIYKVVWISNTKIALKGVETTDYNTHVANSGKIQKLNREYYWAVRNRSDGFCEEDRLLTKFYQRIEAFDDAGNVPVQFDTSGTMTNALRDLVPDPLVRASYISNYYIGSDSNKCLFLGYSGKNGDVAQYANTYIYGETLCYTMTLVTSITYSTQQLGMFYLTDPPEGRNTITLYGSFGEDYPPSIAAISFSRVDPTTPYEGLITTSNVGSGVYLSINSSSTNTVLGIFGTHYTANVTPTSTGTEWVDFAFIGGSNKVSLTTDNWDGSGMLGWTMDYNITFAAMGLEVRKVPESSVIYLRDSIGFDALETITVFSETSAPKDDTAWVVTKMLIDGSNGKITSDNIDWDSFAEWNDWNNDQCLMDDGTYGKRHQFDAVVDFSEDLWNIAFQAAATARGILIRKGDKYSVVMDKAVTTPSQVFTEGNVANVSVEYIPTSERANILVTSFVDRDDNYQERSISEEDIGSTERPITKTIPKMIGVTREWQVRQLLKWMLKQNRYITHTIRFDAGIDSIEMEVGDVFYFQSKVANLAVGGRIYEVDGSNVILDQYFTPEAAEYTLVIWGSDGTKYTKTYTFTSTDETNEFPLPTGYAPDELYYENVFMLYKTSLERTKYRCLSIKREGNTLNAAIVGIEYRSEVYEDD